MWKYQNRQVMLLYKGAGLMESDTLSKQLKPDGTFHFLLVASTEGGATLKVSGGLSLPVWWT